MKIIIVDNFIELIKNSRNNWITPKKGQSHESFPWEMLFLWENMPIVKEGEEAKEVGNVFAQTTCCCYLLELICRLSSSLAIKRRWRKSKRKCRLIKCRSLHDFFIDDKMIFSVILNILMNDMRFFWHYSVIYSSFNDRLDAIYSFVA